IKEFYGKDADDIIEMSKDKAATGGLSDVAYMYSRLKGTSAEDQPFIKKYLESLQIAEKQGILESINEEIAGAAAKSSIMDDVYKSREPQEETDTEKALRVGASTVASFIAGVKQVLQAFNIKREAEDKLAEMRGLSKQTPMEKDISERLGRGVFKMSGTGASTYFTKSKSGNTIAASALKSPDGEGTASDFLQRKSGIQLYNNGELVSEKLNQLTQWASE